MFWLNLHGAFTHFPVALLLTGAAFEVGAYLFRKTEWRIVSFWLLVAAVVLALPSLATGWVMATGMFGSAWPSGPPVFVQHRTLAISTSVVAALLLAGRVVRRDATASRGSAVAAVLVFVLAAVGAGLTGYLGGEMVLAGAPGSSEGGGMEGGAKAAASPIDPGLVAQGENLFQTYRCQGCHAMNGVGAHAGPDLSHEARRHADLVWQVAHLKDPQKVHPGSAMPSQADLPEEDLKALAAYLATRK
jgi:mono/diheme cytochrome c family protein